MTPIHPSSLESTLQLTEEKMMRTIVRLNVVQLQMTLIDYLLRSRLQRRLSKWNE